MQLKSASLDWALKHILKEGDTDLFPRPFEFKIIKEQWSAIKPDLEKIHINGHSWSGPRRLMVPKSDFAFRSICQLDPIDSILFSATIKEVGSKIERKRIPVSEKKVFSYRFSPSTTGQLYARNTGWEQFWRASEDQCDLHQYVLVTDLSDFYNQIYHHTIENQLDECGISKEYWHAINRLIANITEGVSRGVPIGPHASHIIAEMAMIPIDNYLTSSGIPFCRYVDDIHIFCNSRDHAHALLYQLVEYLDKTQKMQINKQKTNIYKSDAYAKICHENTIDKPINALELELIRTVRGYTNSPYERISIKKVSASDISKLSQSNIETVLHEYITAPDIDYIRLRWFIRRLAQVGVPGGIPYMIKNFDDFLPAIAEVSQYFESASINHKGNWKEIGDQLVGIYERGIVQASEYLKVIILSLFSRIDGINHIDKLTKIYGTSSSICQRKIMLAAAENGAKDWLRSLKDAYKNADPWTRRAIIYSLRVLPKDEREHWLKAVKKRAVGIESQIIKAIE